MQIENFTQTPGRKPSFQAEIRIEDLILFDIDFQLRIRDVRSGQELHSRHIRQQGIDIAWLPQGSYQVSVKLPGLNLPADDYFFDLLAWSNANGEAVLHHEVSLPATLEDTDNEDSLNRPEWQIKSLDGSCRISELSWNKQHDDWFFRHFDHASRVVINMMLGDSPQLKGKILDVGCGDGIIDLAVFLRCQPELLVGIDPFKGFERLPAIVASNHVPAEVLDDSRLQFKAADGNNIPYADDYFDVVLSWGSLEHIAGGYKNTLLEIRRVLKPGGLFFVHPGLFYGPVGNHLGEFFDDPYLHLKIPEEALREKVLNTRPELMDRSGDTATPEQYWQWYTELNRITVNDFEAELRALNFEPWRVALRNNNMVEYTAELQNYSFTDLATSELYLSVINRK